MTETMKFSVAPTRTAPTSRIKRVEPLSHVDNSKCECIVNLGIFFDGTNNNYERDKPKLKHSNVARLFDAYLDRKGDGYFRLYLPGVGTPFPEIGEMKESSLGNGFAIGSEQRVLFALCWVLNSLHRAGLQNPLLTQAQIRALCRNQAVASSIVPMEDLVELRSLGLNDGLRMPDSVGEGERDTILGDFGKKLQAKLVKAPVKLKECLIDVFGFSRGAAQARVFCSWLERLLENGMLAGIPIRFRFLGIMDTVASAGFWSSMTSGVLGTDGGHSGWADAQYLRIPPSILNCVHMVAMHELRRNFPLDTVTVGGALPPNCQEFTYPGAHSDVGGGYEPGALGISVGRDAIESDALKLSQIPLAHMLECAVAAGVPVKAERAERNGYKPFAVQPQVLKVVEDFLAASTLKPRPVHEWLQPYLNWRWQVRQRFRELDYVKKATAAEREVLINFNDMLIRDAALMEYRQKAGWFRRRADPTVKMAEMAISRLDEEAQQVLDAAKKAKPTEAAALALFGGFVHDSLAGFNRAEVEWTGYWKFRKGFLGNRRALIASNDPAGDPDQATA